MKQKIELREKAKTMEPILRIGKSGLTEGVISEIKKQLKQKKLIKVKFIRPEDMDKKDFAKQIAEKTGAELIHHIGFVVVLYRR